MKICLQAGHKGRTTGATGAPGEQEFTSDIADKVSIELQKRGFETKVVPADPTPEEIAGDWDLFLAIHYDADSYGTGGFFEDTPLNDGVSERSKAIAYLIRQEYGGTTNIAYHPERRNKNTWDYYMWHKISWNTPCVIIECGVGMHVPDDHEVLAFHRPLVVEGLVKGICLSFNVPYALPEPPTPPVVPPEPSPAPEPTPMPSNPPLSVNDIKLNQIKSIVWNKWTWVGTKGWKSRLSQLRSLLPFE